MTEDIKTVERERLPEAIRSNHPPAMRELGRRLLRAGKRMAPHGTVIGPKR
jgi:hypothetical protein